MAESKTLCRLFKGTLVAHGLTYLLSFFSIELHKSLGFIYGESNASSTLAQLSSNLDPIIRMYVIPIGGTVTAALYAATIIAYYRGN